MVRNLCFTTPNRPGAAKVAVCRKSCDQPQARRSASARARPRSGVRAVVVEVAGPSRRRCRRPCPTRAPRPGCASPGDARGDVDRHPADVVADAARTRRCAGRRAARARAPRRPRRSRARSARARRRRAVEDDQEAVADRLDLAAVEAVELAADRGVVGGEQVAPARVAEPRGVAGRADDVGEQDGQQRALDARAARPPVRNSSISPISASVSPTLGRLSIALELDVARARDALGQVARVADVDQAVAGAVQDQRRDAERRRGRRGRRTAPRLRHRARIAPGLGGEALQARRTRRAAARRRRATGATLLDVRARRPSARARRRSRRVGCSRRRRPSRARRRRSRDAIAA